MPISTSDDVGELFMFAGQALTSSVSPSSSVSSSSSPSTITITPDNGGGVGNASVSCVAADVNNHPLRQYSSSHQRRFHRRFPAIDPHEKLIDWYSCALVAEILLQGYLYISENYFAFYSNILGYKTQLLIPICDVISVTKEKTAKIFPNAVGICTDQTKYVFGSLLSRESTFRLMQEVWKSTLIQVVTLPTLPYFSPVIKFDSMSKRIDADILLEKPEQMDDDDDDDDDDDTEEAESAVPLTSESLTSSTNNNSKSNTQSVPSLIFKSPCLEPHHPETIKFTSEITSIRKILSSTNHQRPNETDSSGSDSDADREQLIYQDSCTNLINEPSPQPTNFKLSHKKRQSITLTHYGSNWIVKAKNWVITSVRPYQQILWNQITDTTRLLVMTTTLLIMLFLSALIFLYRVEQVHNELLSLQQNTETNDFNQVQSKQIELRKEIKRLVTSLEEKTTELSVLKERIEEILNSYNHLSACST